MGAHTIHRAQRSPDVCAVGRSHQNRSVHDAAEAARELQNSPPTAERVTVISGEFNFGMGDKLDQAKAEKLGSGGFVDLPANMSHFAFTSPETVIQIDSDGPFVIKYVNPADDPSKSQ